MKYYLVCHCRYCDVIRNIKEGWHCGNWGCTEYDDVVDAMNKLDKVIPFIDQVWTIYDEEYNVIAQKSSKKLNTPEFCKRTLEIKEEEVKEDVVVEDINIVEYEEVEIKPKKRRKINNRLDLALSLEDL